MSAHFGTALRTTEFCRQGKKFQSVLRVDMGKNGDRVFGPSEAKGGCEVDPAKTAVVFIEYQNEFTTEGGKMHDAVKVSHTFLVTRLH